MKRVIAMLFFALFLVAGCGGGDGAETTETTDTAATAEADKDFATRVGDTVGTATANAEKLQNEENERVDEVNEAMEE